MTVSSQNSEMHPQVLLKYTPRRRVRTVSKDSSYYECVKASRAKLSEIIQTKLVEACGDPDARMMWTCTAYYGTPQITYKYGVQICGWPVVVPFDSPGRISSLRKLSTLIRGFQQNKISFKRLHISELEALAASEHSSLGTCIFEARRVDTGRRPNRGPATISKRLVKRTVKTSRLTTGKED